MNSSHQMQMHKGGQDYPLKIGGHTERTTIMNTAAAPDAYPSHLYARGALQNIYLDYLNNYITVARYAECNGLTYEQGEALINIAREVFNSPHPDA